MHRRRGKFGKAWDLVTNKAARVAGRGGHVVVSAWQAHVARDTTAIGVLLDLAAFSCFSIAAGMLALPAGIAVAGVCCLVLNARLSTESR